MLAAGRGSIVNIGSMSGFIVNKPQPQAYYNASKAGVHHLTKSLAAEWAARGVRVNAVAPTYINTPLTAFVKTNQAMYDAWIGGTPMARMGEPDEIASVVLFLASDAASLMTGIDRAGRRRLYLLVKRPGKARMRSNTIELRFSQIRGALRFAILLIHLIGEWRRNYGITELRRQRPLLPKTLARTKRQARGAEAAIIKCIP